MDSFIERVEEVVLAVEDQDAAVELFEDLFVLIGQPTNGARSSEMDDTESRSHPTRAASAGVSFPLRTGGP